MADEFRLGVDFGTSNTAAVLRWPDGTIRPLLFDGSELLPSAVCLDRSGTLLAGRDALHAGRAWPEGFEPNPKRCIDDGTVQLSGTEVLVVDLVAAVLGRVAAVLGRVGTEARRVAGGQPGAVILTCPAAWGTRRREILRQAAVQAGLGWLELVVEPVAAAAYFIEVAGGPLPLGGCVVVYDFGAGTFDASVVQRTADGLEVLGERGLTDAGGLDVDAAIVAYLGTVYAARDQQLWQRLSYPTTPADRRAARQLWEDVRAAKELLSRTSSVTVHVPLFDDDAPLGREHVEQLARPVLDRTVQATRVAIREAGVGNDAIAGLFLVGGSSRIPLAATLLHQALRVAPTVIDRPELVVAEGSLHSPRPRPLEALASDPVPTPVLVPESTPAPAPAAGTASTPAPVPLPNVPDQGTADSAAPDPAPAAVAVAIPAASPAMSAMDSTEPVAVPFRRRRRSPPLLAAAGRRAGRHGAGGLDRDTDLPRGRPPRPAGWSGHRRPQLRHAEPGLLGREGADDGRPRRAVPQIETRHRRTMR